MDSNLLSCLLLLLCRDETQKAKLLVHDKIELYIGIIRAASVCTLELRKIAENESRGLTRKHVLTANNNSSVVVKYNFNSKETSSEQRNLSHSGGGDRTEESKFYVTEDIDSEEDVHIGIGGVVEETLATIK